MPKALTITGMVVAILIVLLFGLDLGVGFPFNYPKKFTMDVGFLVAGLVLGYLSWSSFRELP